MGRLLLSCRSGLGGGRLRSFLQARRCPRAWRGASQPCESLLSSENQQPDCQVRDYHEEYEVEYECLPGLGSASSDLDRGDRTQEVAPSCRVIHCKDEGD